MATITQEVLRHFVHYDAETGVFTWLDDCRRGLKGARAGSVHRTGYRSLRVAGKSYSEHRLAWFYVHGVFPQGDLDHINRNRSDNRIGNLRETTDLLNCQNKGMSKRNTSGYKGVHWCKRYSMWRASIRVNWKLIHLGRFADIKDAANAYEEASRKYHPLAHTEN